MDNGRVRQIRALYWLECEGETRHYFSKSRTIRGREFAQVLDSRSGLIIGDFLWLYLALTSNNSGNRAPSFRIIATRGHFRAFRGGI